MCSTLRDVTTVSAQTDLAGRAEVRMVIMLVVIYLYEKTLSSGIKKEEMKNENG